MLDGVVRWPDRPAAPGRVAAVTVSYNTCELTALLLWSLRRILEWESLEIVVVDNGSKDGSAELLAKIDAAGGCQLIANAGNIMHGPALTQAMSFLASKSSELPRWVWLLDSDVVISRPDALHKAVARAEETGTAIVGEPWWDSWHETNRFLAYSLLIDPARVWCRPSAPRLARSTTQRRSGPSSDLIEPGQILRGERLGAVCDRVLQESRRLLRLADDIGRVSVTDLMLGELVLVDQHHLPGCPHS
jgi:glycosyltransferase involved in cell wall biosynthesis